MKNKLLALLATIGLVGSASAVKINDNISINGFIDTSWSSIDSSAGNDDNDLDVDEVELNFLVNAGNVSGELHLDNSEDADGNNENFDIEQVHFTYGFENGVSIQIGQFGSALGFEREDPAGLYTFSRAYGDNAYNLGNVDVNVGEGARLAYSTDSISAGFAVYNAPGDSEETSLPLPNGTSDDLNYEFAITFTGIENLSITAGVQGNRIEDPAPAGEADTDTTNLHAAYTIDKLLLAAEYVNIDVDAGDDLSAYLLLADYDINDKMGIAVRYSEWETGANADSDQITIAPNYSITDSLGAILEYSSAEDNAGNEQDTLALELTFTF